MSKRTFGATFVLITALAMALIPMTAGATTPVTAQSGTAAPTVPPTPAPTNTPVVVDNGSGATKLVYWNGLTGGDGDVMQGIVANFAKDNPTISVHTEEYDWNTMFQKLQASFVAGKPPDVFVLHTSEIPQFAKLGILASSDDMLDSGGGSLPAKDFNGINATVVDGKHYGIMWDNHGFGTWVNLNLFQKAGVDASTPFPTNTT